MEKEREDARIDLEDVLAGTGEDETGGGEDGNVAKLTWNTVIPKCPPCDEHVEFPGHLWVTYCCPRGWGKDDACIFVWCPKCKADSLKQIKKGVGVGVEEEGNTIRRSNRSDIDVAKYRGVCGAHTYADLMYVKSESNKKWRYEEMLKKYDADKLVNIPKNCWGCGKLL